MWWRASIVAVFMLASLGGCGFHPLYGEQNSASPVSEFLSGIEVTDTGAGHEGELLRQQLEDHFRSAGKVHSRSLRVTLKKRLQPIGIERDRRISRYNVIWQADFALIDVTSGKTLMQGKHKTITGYNVVESDFATFMADRDAVERGISELAEGIRARISSWAERHADTSSIN